MPGPACLPGQAAGLSRPPRSDEPPACRDRFPQAGGLWLRLRHSAHRIGPIGLIGPIGPGHRRRPMRPMGPMGPIGPIVGGAGLPAGTRRLYFMHPVARRAKAIRPGRLPRPPAASSAFLCGSILSICAICIAHVHDLREREDDSVDVLYVVAAQGLEGPRPEGGCCRWEPVAVANIECRTPNVE